MPAVACHGARDGILIAAHDVAQILRIESLRQRGGTDQITEHDSQLPPIRRRAGHGGGRGCRWRGTGKVGGRLPQFLAMAKREPEFLQLIVGKIGKNVEIEVVFGEQISVFAETEPFQPMPDISRHAISSAAIVSDKPDG